MKTKDINADSNVPTFVKSIFALVLLNLSVILPAGNLNAQTTPPADITITGESADDDFGWQVAPAGDVNGDGVSDLIAGAPSNDFIAGFAGRAYLFYGPLPATLMPRTRMRSSRRRRLAITLGSRLPPPAM